MKIQMQNTRVEYFRNFIFGVEDSLVSTVGLLSGIALADATRQGIFLTGLVYVSVEAFSMAAGSFLSERSAEEYQAHGEVPAHKSTAASVIMFFSYFLSGFVPLTPYLLMSPETAIWYSVVASLSALGLLGIIGARMSGIKILHNSLRMIIVGGAAIGVGVFVGQLVETL